MSVKFGFANWPVDAELWVFEDPSTYSTVYICSKCKMKTKLTARDLILLDKDAVIMVDHDCERDRPKEVTGGHELHETLPIPR